MRLTGISCYLLPVTMRVPLKFGSESIDSVTCLRCRVTVVDEEGNEAIGWGETPLSVTWAWPSATISYSDRYDAMIKFSRHLADDLVQADVTGHPIEIGHHLSEHLIPARQGSARQEAARQEAGRSDSSAIEVPQLAALIIASAYDIALHDAYGRLHGRDIYQLYGRDHLSVDLSHFLQPEAGSGVDFDGRYLDEFLESDPPQRMPVWHLVGGLDPLESDDCTGEEPDDGYPVTLRQWIQRDGLTCLKIKLRGNDAQWDQQRIIRVGRMAIELGCEWLSTDFNCTVQSPDYVNEILDGLKSNHREVFDLIRYVEQPFPHDLEANQIDVHSVSERCDLFLDESAHDWRFVALGKRLGWNGVALKTCKTQTGALLSLCWAKAHGMPLMVQDLTNPMLAQIPHVRLAAAAGTIAGVESNGMQFYPDASLPEQAVHPGIYCRRDGHLDLSTISGPGFGYRETEVDRTLPEPAFEVVRA